LKAAAFEELEKQSEALKVISEAFEWTKTPNANAHYSMINRIKEKKNAIHNKMLEGSNNLFTFAKAFPVVEQDERGEVSPIGDYNRSKFDLATKVTARFDECGKEV